MIENERQEILKYKEIISMNIDDASLENTEVFLSFKIENKWWLVNLSDISGTSLLNSISKMGRVQPWFIGISNFRGQVYPVINLQYFITGKDFKVNMAKENAILSSPKYGLSFALIIPEMDLMISKSMLTEMETEKIDKSFVNSWAKRYWENEQKELYAELDIEKLLISPEFLNIYENNKVNT